MKNKFIYKKREEIDDFSYYDFRDYRKYVI